MMRIECGTHRLAAQFSATKITSPSWHLFGDAHIKISQDLDIIQDVMSIGRDVIELHFTANMDKSNDVTANGHYVFKGIHATHNVSYSARLPVLVIL